MNESLIPRPNAAGPTLPAPNLEIQTVSLEWFSSLLYIRNLRQYVRIRCEPHREHLIESHVCSTFNWNGDDSISVVRLVLQKNHVLLTRALLALAWTTRR